MQKTDLPLMAKFIETIRQNLPSDISDSIMQTWIQSPERLQKVLKDALCPALASQPKFFRTIRLGTHKNVDALRKALTKAGDKIGPWADDILGKLNFTVSRQEVDVDLWVASVAELGFRDGASYNDICARAIARGFELCPAEVGPQLRLQYKDQPPGDWIRVAMKAITDSDGLPGIFAVGRDYFAPCLRGGDDGRPENFWKAHERFAFVRRK